jgi:DhnA family fructose-bisphosphate aldolase class Ia
MNTGKQVRLRKLWKQKCSVIIPYDHGQYSGITPGLEDVRRLTARIASTPADGILVTPGILKQVSGDVGDLGVLVRMDGGFTRMAAAVTDYQEMCPVEDVLRMGGDAGIVFTFVGTPFEAESLRRLGRTAASADAWGLPLVAEILAPSLLNNHFGLTLFGSGMGEKDVERETADVLRIGAEAGADVIKTRYSGNREAFRRAVRACGVPVIVAGGPALDSSVRPAVSREEALLRLASECVEAGAAGIIFGRNVWQHPKMEKVIGALCAVVHEGESVPKAMKLLR